MALKRTIDFVAALILLTVIAPVLGVLGAGLRRSTRASAIFRQRRAGRSGHPFVLYKLRTMTEARDQNGHLLSDRQRLTRLGRVVRSFSLDELPQLWNVIRGEMSLVGPRPLPVEYIALYSDRERKRLGVLPGITGWAQINGRQRISFGKRLDYDAWYVEHWSLGLDLKIILLTIPRLLRRTDVALGQEPGEVDDRGFAELWRHHRLRGTAHDLDATPVERAVFNPRVGH